MALITKSQLIYIGKRGPLKCIMLSFSIVTISGLECNFSLSKIFSSHQDDI